MAPICNLLGIVYQTRDGRLNLFDVTITIAKEFTEDITEEKLSFPRIHQLNYENKNIPKEKHFLLDTIISETSDIGIKLKIIMFLKGKSKSLDYSKETIKNLTIIVKE